MRADDFFAFARARHTITLARDAGLPTPWTDDPILASYRFTNVFRELDRTTVWFRENVGRHLAEMTPEQQLLGVILFRTFNRISSMEKIFFGKDSPAFACQGWGWEWLRGEMDTAELERRMRYGIPPPWVTGAYIVKTPDGMDKLAGALWIVEEARKRAAATLAALGPSPTLQSLHTALVAYPYLGGFTAYEIVSDLRWLPLMRDAPDIMSWAHAGPGAVRGLNRIHGREVKKSLPQYLARTEMMMLLQRSRDPDYWPQQMLPINERDEWTARIGHSGPSWPRWEMREVEHTLCEFDKYERVRLGEGKPRGRFP